jgi:hypothetical protein
MEKEFFTIKTFIRILDAHKKMSFDDDYLSNFDS